MMDASPYLWKNPFQCYTISLGAEFFPRCLTQPCQISRSKLFGAFLGFLKGLVVFLVAVVVVVVKGFLGRGGTGIWFFNKPRLKKRKLFYQILLSLFFSHCIRQENSAVQQ